MNPAKIVFAIFIVLFILLLVDAYVGCPVAKSPKCPTKCTNLNATKPYSDFAKYRFSYAVEL